MDTSAIAMLAVLVVAAVGTAAWHLARRQVLVEAESCSARIRELEKEVHLRERAHLERCNKADEDHRSALDDLRRQFATELVAERASAYASGREQGLAEQRARHTEELTNLRLAMVGKHEQERDAAVNDARERLRAEYELQTKLFSVKIAPYVEIREIGSLLSKSQEASTGYQYQLLVNGIPAFSPHVVIEQKETRKEVNEEMVGKLVDVASRIAEQAIQVYLGGNSQFAKLASPILRRLPGK